jgi:hypothetical protein
VKAQPYYSIQAVVVYVALGVALGLVGWALLIHDGGGSGGAGAGSGVPVKSAPAKGNSQR